MLARERRYQWIAATLVAVHMLLILAYTLPRQMVAERFRVLGQWYAAPLFHQQWWLFAPDPPVCAGEVQVVLPGGEARPLDAASANYLTRRMARTIAWYVSAEVAAGDTVPTEALGVAMRSMVRDLGREQPELRFRLVQHCVTDADRPLERTERITQLTTR